ncbi:MAG: YqgE/AlgH family protein [Pirellulaceae bacterium]|nr:YqgE/AlgH family protein [Pirellulaceae bacterium]
MNRFSPSDPDFRVAPKFALEGALLVAAPQVEDELYGRSVCLMIRHDSEQSIGVVLNRPFSLDVTPLWEQLTNGLAKTANPPPYLNFGGPNSGPVVAIHDRESLADSGSESGIYLAAHIDTLKKLALVDPEHYRLLVGHSAWKPGVLEREISEGIWYPLPASPDLVFVDDYDMWIKGMRRVGGFIVQSVIGLDSLPSSPHLN